MSEQWHMRKTQYREGPEATKAFEKAMESLFKAPKGVVVRAAKKANGKKKQATSRAQSVRKPRASDKD